ncbi:hypothetical protein LPJ59_003179 [Coemansia sp. RSA 2399]|nr:hypothetical protein LPJ59_003179 [Coemansia sp. RSA 2399]KAJ1903874.1 hypothetical protein LPJ81_002828 [Coemansia sp. IMI 209127]
MGSIGFPAIILATIIVGLSEFGKTHVVMMLSSLIVTMFVYIIFNQLCLLYMGDYAGLRIDYSKRTNIGICYLPFAICPYESSNLGAQLEALKVNYTRLMDLAVELVGQLSAQVEANDREQTHNRLLTLRRSERQLQQLGHRAARY